MIIYTSLLTTGGFTCTPWLILINSKWRGDAGLLAHERVHQAQMRRVGTLWFWWRYLTHQPFRQACEVEAYRLQMEYGAPLEKMAELLSTGYRIGMPLDDAKRLLKD